MSEHGNLVIGECALDAVRVVAETIVTVVFFQIYVSIVVSVRGSSAQGSKMLVVEEAQVMLCRSILNAFWDVLFSFTHLSNLRDL